MADIKISELQSASTVSRSDLVEISQYDEQEDEYTSLSTTLGDIADLAGGGGGGGGGLTMKTKTYTGDGTTPLVVTFSEKPKYILEIEGDGEGSYVVCKPFPYGSPRTVSFYVQPALPSPSTGGGVLYNSMTYSNNDLTMTMHSSAGDTGAHWNQSGKSYTIYYLV